MAQNNKKFNNKRFITFFSVGAGIAFALVLILGLLLDFLFYGMVFYAAIIVPLIGFCGGLWLWNALSASKLIVGITRGVKRAALLIAIGLVIPISLCVAIALYCDMPCLSETFKIWGYLLLAFLCYLGGGAIYSIWNLSRFSTSSKSETKHLSSAEFPDWVFIKRVVKTLLKAIAVWSAIIPLGWIIFGEVITSLTIWGWFGIYFSTFTLGYLIWAHIKKANLLVGKFQKQLKLLSVVLPLAVGGAIFLRRFDKLLPRLLFIPGLNLLLFYFSQRAALLLHWIIHSNKKIRVNQNDN